MTSTKTSPVIAAIQREIVRRKLSLYALAKVSGAKHYTLRRLMADEGSPTLATLEAVAKALGLAIRVERA